MVLHIRVWESSTTPDLYLTPFGITVAPGMHKGVFLFHFDIPKKTGRHTTLGKRLFFERRCIILREAREEK